MTTICQDANVVLLSILREHLAEKNTEMCRSVLSVLTQPRSPGSFQALCKCETKKKTEAK